jgi:hypothetical protein
MQDVQEKRVEEEGAYFNVLFACMVASVVLIFGVAEFLSKIPPGFAIVIGSLPLAGYHLIYLRPRARTGLSQAAVDSVYYFGFLITVAALAISAISIARSGSTGNLNHVIYQFGIGLMATAYAVVARMHLTSLATKRTSDSVEAVFTAYIERSRELVDNVGTASAGFERLAQRTHQALGELDHFSKEMMERNSLVMARTQLLAVKAVQDSARAFDQEMKSSLASSTEALSEVRHLVSDVVFQDERLRLLDSFKAISAGAEKLNTEFGNLAAGANTSVDLIGSMARSNTEVAEMMSMFKRQVKDFAGSDGSLSDAAMAVRSVVGSIASSAGELQKTVLLVKDVAGGVNSSAAAHQRFVQVIKEIEYRLQVLSDTSSRFSDVLEKVAASTPAAGVALVAHSEAFATNPVALNSAVGAEETMGMRFATSEAAANFIPLVEKLGQTLRSVEDSLSRVPMAFGIVERELSDSATKVRASVAASAQALENDVRRSSEAASLLTAGLVQVANNIVDQTRAHQAATV